MAGQSFVSMLRVGGFLGILWASSKLMRLIGVSTILAEILVGMAMGPQVAKVLPHAYDRPAAEFQYNCGDKLWAKDNMAKWKDGGFSEDGKWVIKSHRRLQQAPPLLNDTMATTVVDGPLYLSDVENTVPDSDLLEQAPSWRGRGEVSRAVERRRLASDGDECKDVTEDHQCCHDQTHHGQNLPSIFVLIGQAGVALMIFESGMHFDFGKVRQVGGGALVVALIGTLLPIGLGMLFVYMLEGFDGSVVYSDENKSGLAAGVSLAPTSVGIALKLLMETKQLGTDYGQAVITAAFADDVLSLLAFIVLEQLKPGEEITFQVVGVPAITSVALLVFGAFAAVKIYPKYLPKILHKIKEDPKQSFQPRDALLLVTMFATLIGFAELSVVAKASHLLGCFVAGMCFTGVHRAHHIWKTQTKRITAWMVRLFFGATVGFAIPTKELGTIDAFWKGVVLAVFPAIGAKVVSGLHMGPAKWVVGWAMVGRAEFAYFIAESAVNGNLTTPQVFAQIIWALLICTAVSPFLFKFVLLQQMKKKSPVRSPYIRFRGFQEGDRGKPSHNDNSFRVQIAAPHKTGVIFEIVELLHDVSLDILAIDVHSDGETDIGVYTVVPRGGKGVVDEEKLKEVQHNIVDALDHHDARVVFLPGMVRPSLAPLCKISLLTSHHPDLMPNLLQLFAEETVTIEQGNVEQLEGLGATYACVFLCRQFDTQSRVRAQNGPADAGSKPAEIMFTEEKLNKIRTRICDIFDAIGLRGEVMCISLDPEQAGPTGDIAHDPFQIHTSSEQLEKVRLTFDPASERTPVMCSNLLSKVTELLHDKSLNLVAARISPAQWLLYMDDATQYRRSQGSPPVSPTAGKGKGKGKSKEKQSVERQAAAAAAAAAEGEGEGPSLEFDREQQGKPMFGVPADQLSGGRVEDVELLKQIRQVLKDFGLETATVRAETVRNDSKLLSFAL
ncbi:unnamed protein product [Vitrella brassicaformis CCMP3155]|uniref:ACT domain-containing protein n=3 Tax=Vitrella brassicaformis TaxID=1169539 RepID=A0A0G4ENS2_VITBC|nr:unnamed protein product [Vitrella brassicaformis CCMP3155]|eukprot:CEL99258.1 unnamed protein product [Vitrella brassicaformis CCMP3155]